MNSPSVVTSRKPTVVEDVAAQAVAYDATQVGGAEAAKAAQCLVDFLSCALESVDLPWGRNAAALAAPYGETTIIGSAMPTLPEDAAFANGVLGHGLVREDMHAGSICHLGVVIWPTLLAIAETRTVTGAELIRAAVIGYEFGGRLGRKVVTPDVARLFRPTGLVGPYAATLAGGLLMGFDADRLCAALGLAGNVSAGLNDWPHSGSDEMYFHPGYVARNALRSLRLAEMGSAGSATIIEGQSGMSAAYARKPFEGRIALFPEDQPAEILEVFNKEVPACNFAQSPCQAAVRALQSAGATGTDVARIRIDTYDAALNYPGCANTGTFRTPLQAKMSIAFGVAAALDSGAILESNYAKLDDPEVRRLIDATSFSIDERLNAAFPAKQGTRVSLTLLDGRTVDEAMDNIAYATPDLIRERFREAATDRLGRDRADAILEDIDALTSLPDTAGIIGRCRPGDAA